MATIQPDSEEEEEGEQQDEQEQQEYNPAWEGQHQQQQGPWDPWPNHQQQQQRFNNVPYEDFLQLNQCVGEIDQTLHGVNEDVSALTHNFSHFMTHFLDYYQQHPCPPLNDDNN